MYTLYRLKVQEGMITGAEYPRAGTFSVHALCTLEELRRRKLTEEQINRDFEEVPLPTTERPTGFAAIGTFCEDWVQFLKSLSADAILDKAALGRHLVACVKDAALLAESEMPSYFAEVVDLGDFDHVQRWLAKFGVWAKARASKL
jgi:hypothetical protein